MILPMNRVAVSRDTYRWAADRARLAMPVLATRFPRLRDWEAGTAAPTLKQLEAFAAATYTPVGFFFLQDHPTEAVPIPDFRTARGRPVTAPSANLLDTIYVCQQRQEWYRDFAGVAGEDPLPFVGSVTSGADVVATAASIREVIGIDLAERRRASTWEEALRLFIAGAEDAGVLVMISGVVLNNTHRLLDPDEFLGFAMADSLAPVVFVNGADTKSRQMFTLAHELVHIWAGQTALSNAQPRQLRVSQSEQWCNAVAAETLVPAAAMRQAFDGDDDLDLEMRRLARRFKVSTLVVLRRIYDIGGLSRNAFWEAYDAEVDRLHELRERASPGGNFYLTEAARVSKRFARAIVTSTIEGQTLYRDAFRLLGFSKAETFRDFGQSLGLQT
jgi:Zn-dependent peptidase ImmA (M78 family)